MPGGHPADRSNRQPDACKNSQWMTTASILATESRGSEHTGDAPGDPVPTKSEQFRDQTALQCPEGFALPRRLGYASFISNTYQVHFLFN
jgi:hypothetical protein